VLGFRTAAAEDDGRDDTGVAVGVPPLLFDAAMVFFVCFTGKSGFGSHLCSAQWLRKMITGL